jgi:drug/metabolite transporter (DMT)-like permease
MLTGQAVRYALAAVALAIIVAFSRSRVRPTGREFLLLAAVAGVGLVAFNALLMFSLRHADPALVGTIVGGSPLILALVGPLQQGRRPAPRLVGAAGVVVVGAALVHGGGHADALGVLGALGLLLCEAGFSLLAAPLLPRLGAVRVSAWSCAIAVPILAIAIPLTGERPRVPSAGELSGIVFLGLVLTVAAFVCWYTGVKGLGVERAGVFLGLVPVASLVVAAVADATMPNRWQLLGVAVVTTALVLGLTAHRERRSGTTVATPKSPPRPLPARRRGSDDPGSGGGFLGADGGDQGSDGGAEGGLGVLAVAASLGDQREQRRTERAVVGQPDLQPRPPGTMQDLGRQ